MVSVTFKRAYRLFLFVCFCVYSFSEPMVTDVFVGGLESCPEYRIPAIVTTQKGTLLAFAEGRQTLSDHAENKIVLKRSENDGRTWQPLQVISENGQNSLNNPQAVVLPETGRVLLMYQDFPQNYHSRTIGKKIQRALPGHSGKRVQKTFLIYSDDDGKTWSKPRDITPGVKRSDAIVAVASGPGRGIVLTQRPYAGRIVMPFNESWYEGERRKVHVYAAYSDDGGQTWDYGWPAPHDRTKPGQDGWGNEVQMVELADGTIMLNSRSFQSNKFRKIAHSKDGGQTWSYLQDDTQLPEPQCMGSIIRYRWPESEKKGVLAFSGPGTKEGRHTGTIRLSFDDGKTWPVSKLLESGHFAYSCLTVLKDGRIGCLYETEKYKKIRFAAFSADWITPTSLFRTGNSKFKRKPVEPNVIPPFVVGVPPVDAGRGLIRVNETEIRHYGGHGAKIYLASYDNGRTWQEKPLPDNYPDLIGLTKEGPSFARIPGTNEFLRVSHSSKGKLYRTEGGLDGRWLVIKDKDGNENLFQGILHHPFFAKNGKRWIVPAHGGGMWVYYSDDQGQTWNRSNRVQTPPHAPGGIHKGTRWNHDAAEPSIVRLNDGRLWRLIRCAQDNHYESFSSDDGQTWTEPVPSRFYGTITMPDVGRLRDGRLLMIWNNTTPLPELERATGHWEDVFTNRDVLHAAISEDDGKTWIGFREVILDEYRNDGDYAVMAGITDSGKQQNEFLELEDGVVLLAVGQHPLHRKLIIMDVDWLYETARKDDFSQGLKDWSVHQFIAGIRGHCGYNRKQGASLIPHPDENGKSVLRVRRADDPELVCENDGAVWNFPAGKSGVFTTRIQLQKGFKGGRISLIDRWFNPTDLTAHLFAMFNLEIPADGRMNDQITLKHGQWVELKFEWDGLKNEDSDTCTLYVNGVPQAEKLKLNRQSVNGISYAHFISTTHEMDNAGYLVECVASNIMSLATKAEPE